MQTSNLFCLELDRISPLLLEENEMVLDYWAGDICFDGGSGAAMKGIIFGVPYRPKNCCQTKI